MPDQIEMPANCDGCGGVWDLNSMYSRITALLCPPCKRRLDTEDLADDSDAAE